MINPSKDIHPVTNFKRNTALFLKRMKKSRRPFVLTVKGKAEIVIQDAGSYQTLLDRIDELEAVAAVRRGLKDAEAGRVTSPEEAVRRIRKRHGL
jgi:PHD/YefM family antitoxin component YafN of YafNO toxin-antitoxin module